MSSPLARCLADSGYTPPVAALDELLRALDSIDEPGEKAVRRALTRLGEPAIARTLSQLPEATARHRERLIALLGTLAEKSRPEPVLAALIAALTDAAPRCQRAAARALGKLGDPHAEAPLLEALERADLAERRAIVDALGKLGSESSTQSLTALRSSPATIADADLTRRIDNARALIERRVTRTEASSLIFDRALPQKLTIVARCRSGLLGVLRDEAGSRFRVVSSAEDSLTLEHGGTLGELLELRTALDFGVALCLDESIEDPTERVARALEGPEAMAAFSAFSPSAPRVRIEFVPGGPRRSLAWSIARRLSEGGRVQNDPRGALFTAEVHPDARGSLLLVPQLKDDPRFDYRIDDVPAASHPTIAAALARLGGVRPDDVVWDPFVGSGLELIERARLGAYARLIGSDIKPKALSVTRANVQKAGVERLELVQGDAASLAPKGVTLILTNPPMGRRVARDGSLRPLLERFVENVARVLTPGGRLVWLSPLDQLTARVAERHGLSVEPGPEVDLGGFRARIQGFEQKRSGRRAGPGALG